MPRECDSLTAAESVSNCYYPLKEPQLARERSSSVFQKDAFSRASQLFQRISPITRFPRPHLELLSQLTVNFTGDMLTFALLTFLTNVSCVYGFTGM
jgi:hypothetical protein